MFFHTYPTVDVVDTGLTPTVYVVVSETTAWFDRVDGEPLTAADVETLGCCDANGVYDDDVVYGFTFDNRADAERFVNAPSRNDQRVGPDDRLTPPGFVFNNVDRCSNVQPCDGSDAADALLSGVCDVYHNATW